MPIRASRCPRRFVTLRSLKVTVPVITGSRPVTALSRVDLPAPLGPMTETTSPGPTLMLTPDTMGAPPYPAAMLSSRKIGCGRSRSPGAWLPAGGGAPPGEGLSDEVGIQHLLIGTGVRHGSLRYHPSLGHHDDGVAQSFHHRQFVLDHQHREPFAGQIFQVPL